nr:MULTISPECIES: hypothetical protein [unclassified Allomuricauda]|tara:strand:+ start:4155 stop:4364 length:210 start_codon:yes stop_codon:yes gene_type:complete
MGAEQDSLLQKKGKKEQKQLLLSIFCASVVDNLFSMWYITKVFFGVKRRLFVDFLVVHRKKYFIRKIIK